MAKRIEWTDAARADVRRIDHESAMRILEGLARFLFTAFLRQPLLAPAWILAEQFDVDPGRLRSEQVGEDALPVVGIVEEQQQVAQADHRVGPAARAGQRVRPPVHVAHHVNSHATTVRPAGFPMASAGWPSGNGRPAA